MFESYVPLTGAAKFSAPSHSAAAEVEYFIVVRSTRNVISLPVVGFIFTTPPSNHLPETPYVRRPHTSALYASS